MEPVPTPHSNGHESVPEPGPPSLAGGWRYPRTMGVLVCPACKSAAMRSAWKRVPDLCARWRIFCPACKGTSISARWRWCWARLPRLAGRGIRSGLVDDPTMPFPFRLLPEPGESSRVSRQRSSGLSVGSAMQAPCVPQARAVPLVRFEVGKRGDPQSPRGILNPDALTVPDRVIASLAPGCVRALRHGSGVPARIAPGPTASETGKRPESGLSR